MSEPEDDKVARSIDPEAIERLRSMGGEDLVAEIIDLFRSTASDRVSAVRKGMRDGDLDRVRREARALKSSAGNVGASSVCSLVSEIENEGRSGRFRQVVDLLERECELVRDSLRRVRERQVG